MKEYFSEPFPDLTSAVSGMKKHIENNPDILQARVMREKDGWVFVVFSEE